MRHVFTLLRFLLEQLFRPYLLSLGTLDFENYKVILRIYIMMVFYKFESLL